MSHQRAVRNNRRRLGRAKSKRLQRLRSERVERSFAHLWETGGARRSWLRGVEKVAKRYRIAAAAHNLALIMRKLFGIGKPKRLQKPTADDLAVLLSLYCALWALFHRAWRRISLANRLQRFIAKRKLQTHRFWFFARNKG